MAGLLCCFASVPRPRLLLQSGSPAHERGGPLGQRSPWVPLICDPRHGLQGPRAAGCSGGRRWLGFGDRGALGRALCRACGQTRPPPSPPARLHLSAPHLGQTPGGVRSQDGRVCFEEGETKAQKRGGTNPRSHQGDQTEPKTCTGCQLMGSSLRRLPAPLRGGRGLRDRCPPRPTERGPPQQGANPQPQRVLGCGTLRTHVTFHRDADTGDDSGGWPPFLGHPFAELPGWGATAEFTGT